jgi:hypothetical protein
MPASIRFSRTVSTATAHPAIALADNLIASKIQICGNKG